MDGDAPAGGSGPASGSNRPADLDRALLTQLLKERRYEEALEIVLKARQQSPNDRALSRSVRLLKDRLTLQYAERVGSLDRVPECPLSDDAIDAMSLSFEERGVLALVDGIATFGDIVDASPHGKFATYRALSSFLSREVIHARGEPLTPIPAKVLQQSQQKQRAAAAPPSPAPSTPPVDRSAPPVPDDPSQLITVWEDEEDHGGLKREDTQPMYVMPALPPEPPEEASSTPFSPPPAQVEAFEPPPHPPLPAPRAVEPAPSPAAAAASAAPRPPAPPISSPPAVDYDALFDRATRAYVRRDYDEAMTLFQQYLIVRPDDRRAHHNLEQLRKRRKGS